MINTISDLNVDCLSNSSNIIQVIVGICSLFLTFFTFLLALKVSKEFARNHAKSKQVEKMSKLMEFLNSTKIRINFANVSKMSGFGSRVDIFYNIFEIGNMLNEENTDKLFEHDNKEYDSCFVYLDQFTTQIMDVKKFIDDAFIPKPIADKLLEFYIIDTNIVEREELLSENENVEIVILSSKDNQAIILGPYKRTNCFALLTWLNFKTYSNDLIILLDKWFKKNGINDFNLRIDYKNLK